MTENLPRKKKTSPRAAAAVNGIQTGSGAGLIAYLIVSLTGFILRFFAGVISGSQATLLAPRARQHQT
jgi:hypothetical protein